MDSKIKISYGKNASFIIRVKNKRKAKVFLDFCKSMGDCHINDSPNEIIFRSPTRSIVYQTLSMAFDLDLL